MKNLKLIGLSLGLVCSVLIAEAQSYSEGALIFSQNTPGGTARIQGMGSAQVSLGGDVSLSLSNPAGLGMSNRSSITFTGGFFTNRSETSYYNTLTPDTRTGLSVPQMGVVLHKPGRNKDGFKGGSVAVNFSRSNTYSQRISYGAQPDNSIIDFFLDDVDGLPLSAFDEGGSDYNSITGLGWYTYLFDTIQGFYDSYILDFPANQGEEIDVRGAQSQFSLSYGTNYNDKVFLGAGIGLTTLRYNSEKIFTEDFSGAPINSIYLEENLSINGTGINATLGVIVRPVNVFQFGISYVTPTIYNLNDQWNARIIADWDNYTYPSTGEVLGSIEEETDVLISDYSLTTPSKLTVGATFFLGKLGFVTADVEQVNYSKSSLNSRDFSMTGDNQEISQNYQKATNIRAGAELRFDIFRLRAGGGIQGDPFVDAPVQDPLVKTITAGIGIRKENMFADFAVVRSSTNAAYFPYLIGGAGPQALSDLSNTQALLSIGFNF